MKVTRENYTLLPDNEQKLVLALLDDIDDFPMGLRLEIHWEEYHTEYSPEWVEPCPDYYHTYSIRYADDCESINDGLTVNELDNHMCTLYTAFNKLTSIDTNNIDTYES